MNERAVAARILDQVIHRGRSLSAVLDDTEAAALTREMCFGVLRWYYRLDSVLQSLLTRPLKSRDGDLRCLLLAGLYQLSSMHVAEHAAVSETVIAASQLGKVWARGLVNAVLRNFIRQRETVLREVDAEPAVACAHPQWLLDSIRRDWPAAWQQIVQAANERPPMTLRVNVQHQSRDEYASRLQQAGVPARAHELVNTALVLDSPVSVDRLPGFYDGAVSVQDAAAQLAATLMSLMPGQRVLDACAAPGGKTTHLLELQPRLDRVWAVDHDRTRLDRVKENLARERLDATLVCGDAACPADWWDNRPFDRILLDAPCSATGVIRRHPDIKVLRRAQDIASLVQQQRAILDALWPLLLPGGRLMYVTCSILAEENHEQIEAFLSCHADAHENVIEADWGRPLAAGRQILPGESGMDGFYYACLTKG